MKYIKYIHMNYIAVFLFALIVYVFPQYASAEAVPVNYTNLWYDSYDVGAIRLRTTYSMSLDKQFILQAQGIRNLTFYEGGAGDIPVGVNLLGYNYDTTGSYNYFKGDYGTPPMDNQVYVDYSGTFWLNVQVKSEFRGGVSSQLGYTLSSSNNGIIDCSAGTSCRTVGQGTATVTVSFPGNGNYYIQRAFDIGYQDYDRKAQTCTTTQVCTPAPFPWNFFGFPPTCVTSAPVCTCDAGYTQYQPQSLVAGRYVDSGSPMCRSNARSFISSKPSPGFPGYTGNYGALTAGFNYSLQPISYTIRVQNPNQAPTVAYTGTTAIGYNTATANWSYSDVDGDAQVWSHVQIATDPGFGNIIANKYQNSSAANMGVSGLIPGTTYYPRVRVYNAVNGWTGYVNGPAFTTLANNPPNLGEFSCSGTPTGYTSARVNWNYTGSDPDGLVLTMRYIKPGDPAWTTVNLPGNRTGARDIINLISGFGYNVEISVTDIYNTYLTDRWKGCGTVTPTEYPIPTVNFNLSSGTNTAGSGGTLTINTGDPISTNWTITNTAGLQDNSCTLSNTGVRTIFNESGLGFGLDSRQNNNVAADTSDRTYAINLSCPGKPARDVRSVNSTITLVIQSRPVVSCTVKNTVVTAGSPLVGITGRVTNGIGPYTWSVSKDGQAGPYTILPGISGANFDFNIDYTARPFGKYIPWLQVVDTTNGRTARKACDKGITNLGDRNIREVNP